jgi:hypothetical protein
MPNGGWGHPPAYDGHHGYRTSYPYYYPYRPYYYARSTYLVPGLLNSYWDDGNGYYGYDDDPPAVAGGAVQPNGQGNDMYAQEPAPEYAPQQQAPYQAQDVPPPPPGPVEPTPLAVTTLVFKDGHSQQVHNYAMTQTTLYVLDDVASGRRVEIPLEKIDLPATQRANQDAGIDFNVPGVGD